MDFKIKKAENGYIVDRNSYYEQSQVYLTLDGVMDFLLLHFEGRCENFRGDKYGKVIIQRKAVE